MTREEMRAVAIEAMAEVIISAYDDTDEHKTSVATDAIDALGAAGFKVIGPDVTEEIHALLIRRHSSTELAELFLAVVDAADLTRKP